MTFKPNQSYEPGIYVYGTTAFRVDRKGNHWKFVEDENSVFLESCTLPLGAMRVL